MMNTVHTLSLLVGVKDGNKGKWFRAGKGRNA